MSQVKLLIIGAGSRGNRYGDFVLAHPEMAKVIAVAEPREAYRNKFAEKHSLSPENTTVDWRELAARPKFADAVVISTQDAYHKEPALAFASRGYDILLEKPIAPDIESCRAIASAAIENNIIMAVCHVLRYTNYTQKLKQLLNTGIIGDILSVQHLEPVGYWHYAHSFVRGNWRNEAASSFMLLAKSCHDIDWLRYIIGSRCVQVSSFGSLQYFRAESKPNEAGSATRCIECNYEPKCAYSAKRFYLDLLKKGDTGWPLDVITTEFTPEGVAQALESGQYGRCVYESDNDVVDHQVVNLLYESGATASFTMIGTSQSRDRQTTIFGTRGELRGNGKIITHYDFLSNKTEEITVEPPTTDPKLSGHGGGDYNLMLHFLKAIAAQDKNLILSGPAESLETHLTTFAAELARKENRVVRVE